ncbi:MAG TPA: hypothetical protein VIH21_08275 [Dehalococcoidia bacterium]
MRDGDSFDFELAHNNEREARTRDQLTRILQTHDVSRWVRTRRIRIEEQAIPHSHPVLTLNTRHRDDDGQLLSTFLHEQIHWIVSERHAETRQATGELRKAYPGVEAGFPEWAADRESSYLHLVVNYLELVAMEEVAGAAEAARVFDLWLTDHYTALYRIVLNDRVGISEIVARHGLMLA